MMVGEVIKNISSDAFEGSNMFILVFRLQTKLQMRASPNSSVIQHHAQIYNTINITKFCLISFIPNHLLILAK